ncbi:MAG: sugar phosphate nucleotidyltransferase [Parachlamydiaceae bacterium]|nr:sugar phosphate nucleotidyltransferase [Parachlamydiaceae bacterium]
MYSIILAAGSGTRIKSITGGNPKQLLFINGEPIICRLIRQLFLAGINKHYLSTHNNSTLLNDCLYKLNGKYGICNCYESLSSKGANLIHLIKESNNDDEGAIVTMGDIVFPEETIKAFINCSKTLHDSEILVGVSKNMVSSSGKYLNLMNKKFTRSYSQECLSSTGLYYLDNKIIKAILDSRKASRCESITDMFDILTDSGYQIKMCNIENHFDINTPSIYEKCKLFFQIK